MDKFTLTQEETILMVIDIQERLVPAMPSGQDMIARTNTLMAAATKLNIPIIATEQYPRGLGKTVDEVRCNFQGAETFEKVTFSCCTNDVTIALKRINRKKILITGTETHVCVFQTVRDLLVQGYQVFVVRDAVCSRTEENYLNGLSLMAAMGAVITNTETVIFDLLKKAGTPLFKEVSPLIK